MKLPRFPIRKSLIPYDDLGIQEVSGDNQVLGDDIGITLAPAIGMGPTGARVLQVDIDGNLFVNTYRFLQYKYSGSRRVLGDYHIDGTHLILKYFDLSEFYSCQILTKVSNFSVFSGTAVALLSYDDSNGNIYQSNNTVFSVDRDGQFSTYLSPIYGNLLTDKNVLSINNVVPGDSLDVHLEVIGI